MRLSKFGTVIACSYIVLAFIGRVLYPFGDEPDWTVRAAHVLHGSHDLWSPYRWTFEIFSGFDIDRTSCMIDAGPFSLWAIIPRGCNEGLYQISARWLISLFVVSPLLAPVIFKSFFIKVFNRLQPEIPSLELGRRIDVLGLTLLFPGIVYYLGLLSHEQWWLTCALLVFLVWGCRILVFLLLIILFYIDFGNSLVATTFFLAISSMNLVRKLGRPAFFIFLGLALLAAFFSGVKAIDYVSPLAYFLAPFSEKTVAVTSALENSGLVDKYNILLRPVITFMTAIFMTPSGIKVPLLYVVSAVALVWLSVSVLRRTDSTDDVYWFVPFFIIMVFVFMLPTYSNAKYYVFMMPWIFYVASRHITGKSMAMFCIAANITVFVSLIAYRL